MQTYTLHNYFRSSTSIRVRAALALKGLEYDYRALSLLDAEQQDPAYLKVNPEGLVPALVTAGGHALSQSLAIIEYLDEVHPVPALLPPAPLARARVRGLAQLVACDIHPLNNLRVLNRLKDEFNANPDQVADWFRGWAIAGFEALETRLARDEATGLFCHGDSPSLADICLFAQALNNRRFDVSIAPYPTIQGIFERCLAMAPFQAAMPERQPDAR